MDSKMKKVYTVKEIVEKSFKNQEFNQKESFPRITRVFDKLIWNEENNEKYIKLDDINKLRDELQKILMKRYQNKSESRGMEPFINYLFVQRIIDEKFDKIIK